MDFFQREEDEGGLRGDSLNQSNRQREYGPLGSQTARPRGADGGEAGDEGREEGALACEPHREV